MDMTRIDVNTVRALVVVSAKEQGVIYELENGTLTQVNYTREEPPEYSDNEGFFTRNTGGRQLGSGNVRETDDEYNLLQYVKAITKELSSHVAAYDPEVIFVFEPEHLQGKIEEHLVTAKNISIITVKHGNYVETEPEEILNMVRAASDAAEDPADPASVDGEENASEKRKILEIGQKISG